MKKSYLFLSIIFFFLLFSEDAYSQNNNRISEIGIRTGDLTDIDFIYKKQKQDDVYSRIRILSGNLNINELSKFNGSFSMGLGVGREKRNPVSDKLYFVTGAEFIGFFSTSIANDKMKFSLTPGMGIVLGFSYLVNDNFIVGIETIPTASFKLSNTTGKLKLNDYNISFNANYLEFFIMFRY